VVVLVGEPTADRSCPADVLDLPTGYCSVTPCTRIPDDWEIRLTDLDPSELFVLVAPIDADRGRFYCFTRLQRGSVAVLPIATSPEAACLTAPPGSADVPLPPPPGSVDVIAPPPLSSTDIGG
jgi:hypothetical protein